MSLFALSGLLIAISSGVMAFLMFVIGKSRLHTLWGFFCISVLIWGAGAFFIGTTSNPAQAEIWWRITHIGVAFIPTLFLHFVLTFLEKKEVMMVGIFYFISISFALLAIFSNLLIADMRFVFNEFYYDSPPGILYPLFTIYFFGLTVYSHWLLYIGYKETSKKLAGLSLRRRQIQYFFLGMLISFAGGSASFLPVYGIDLYPVTNFSVILYPMIIGYAILRLKLFDVRVVATQGFVFLLWIFVGIRFVLSTNQQETLINGTLLMAVFVIGTLLIKGINKEVQAKEEISKLATQLAGANAHLEKLDKMKSEFVSMASHQLRNPLTSIRGYISMLLEGSYGEVTPKMREILEHVSDSSRQMALSVEDYLNVSRIEAGGMKYEIDDCDLRKLVEDTVAEMLPVSLKRGTTIVFEPTFEGPIMAKLDVGKAKQIIQNLADNAMKYTPEGGQVSLILRKDEVSKKVFVDVKDTGIGIAPEALGEIFKKFERAKNANSINVTGTGLGLYIAKQMAEAMGGSITVSSEGEGKGSTFTVTFRMSDAKKRVVS